MLTAARLRPDGAARTYYERTVATDREAYYSGQGEARGEWAGSGAQELALVGEVRDGELSDLLDGRHPLSGEVLRRAVSERTVTREGIDPATGQRTSEQVVLRPVVGFDLTFEAPKSVSLLHALGDELVRGEVGDAHRAAWQDALQVLERYAAVVRSGPQGVVRERTGLVAAGFVHRTNRDGDPHLHTHVVVANLGRTGDGKYRALDGRLLLADWRTAAGHVYQARLRTELTQRLGVEWGPVRAGQADLARVPRGVIEEFSRRRAIVLEEARARGLDTHAGRRIAQVATRPVKRAVDLTVARERWSARAAEHSLDRAHLRALHAHPRTPTVPDPREVANAVLGESGVVRAGVATTTADLLRAVCDQHPEGATADRLIELLEGLTRDPRLVRVPAQTLGAPERFITVELVRVEEHALRIAREGKGQQVGRAHPRELTRALTHTHVHLTREQVEAATLVARADDQIACVIGHAGAGKTTALAAACAALRESGIPVRAAAPSAQAARVLAETTGVQATTLHALLADLREPTRTPAHGCVIIDEASMADTHTLTAAIDAITGAGGRVVLVGDPAQLPAVGPGGLFTALTQEVQTTELVGNRRQSAEWERTALHDLRDGNAQRAMAAYAEHGRITTTRTPEQTTARVVEDWWTSARKSGVQQVVMLAHRNRDVDALNQQARERMRDEDRLGEERTYGSTALAAGDRVVCKHNDYELGARNGMRGTIDHITTAGVVVHADTGERLELPADYATRHIRHGYALTVHAAQGATVDHAFVLASDQRQLAEWGYVALTRARDGTRIYLTEPTRHPAIALDSGTHGGLDDLARAMSRPTAEPLATHQLTDAHAHRDSLSTEARWIRSALAADEYARYHRDPLRELHAQHELLVATRQTTRRLTRARRDLTHQIREVEDRIAGTVPTPPTRRPEPPRPELAGLTTDQLRTRLNEINELLHPAPRRAAARTPAREIAGPELDLGRSL